ncbi:hypothetical protein OEA41_005806 [Lepraria neglecta]|uniref:Uncharacterized protein n=1 Tax=Lepraria neglecta TaxID=209136 RepID=A0AAD9Z6G3_9LECA|nr:hypothetical protein OEA41_005806 [Lepraria neglecta]
MPCLDDPVAAEDVLHGRGVHPIRRNNEMGLQDLAVFGRDLAVLGIVVDHLGQYPDVAGTSGPFRLGGEPSQLGVQIDAVNGVHGQAPRRFAVLVVGFLLESAFTVRDLASFAPRGDAMNFRGKVPDGGSPSFGEAMQAGLHPGDADTERLSERDSGEL